MHRSRLGSVIIDCEDLEACVRFWSGALGVEPERDPEDGVYVGLTAPGGRHIFLQRVPERKTAKTRMHIDIETTTSRPRSGGSKGWGDAKGGPERVLGHAGPVRQRVLRDRAGDRQLPRPGANLGAVACKVTSTACIATGTVPLPRVARPAPRPPSPPLCRPRYRASAPRRRSRTAAA